MSESVFGNWDRCAIEGCEKSSTGTHSTAGVKKYLCAAHLEEATGAPVYKPHKTRTRLPIKCGQCGKKFSSTMNRRFCSKSCRIKNEKGIKPTAVIPAHERTRKCKRCKKEFTPKSGAQVFCSQDCRLVSKNRPVTAKRPAQNYTTRSCIHCGRDFQSVTAARFCSLACSNRHRAKIGYAPHQLKTLHCRGCGVEFHQRNPKQAYCTEKCRVRAKWIRKSGQSGASGGALRMPQVARTR